MTDDPSVPDAVDTDPDDELSEERLDDDFDIATAREQRHQRSAEERDPSEAAEVVDGS